MLSIGLLYSGYDDIVIIILFWWAGLLEWAGHWPCLICTVAWSIRPTMHSVKRPQVQISMEIRLQLDTHTVVNVQCYRC